MQGHRLRPVTVAAIVGATLQAALTACGSSDAPPPAGTGGDGAGAVTARAAQATHLDFDRGNFSHPTRIDNRWTPLVPGTQYVFEGRSDRGRGRRAHRV